MLDIVIDTILDLLKIIPFLFVAFLLMEYLEHSISKKRNILKERYKLYEDDSRETS